MPPFGNGTVFLIIYFCFLSFFLVIFLCLTCQSLECLCKKASSSKYSNYSFSARFSFPVFNSLISTKNRGTKKHKQAPTKVGRRKKFVSGYITVKYLATRTLRLRMQRRKKTITITQTKK